ncbi:hypothetical protein E0M35_26400 [Bacillus thuringiensis]|nr:hypothetical protein E0M35_26400 [Bacillus thuringiensis]
MFYILVYEVISSIFQIYLSQLTIYQRFFQYIYHNSQYINDFFNISITTHNISSIFSIYRFFDKYQHN